MAKQINVSDGVERELSLLALAWDVNRGGAVERLIAEFRKMNTPRDTAAVCGEVPIYCIYKGVRTEGVYFPDTKGILITTGPLAGTRKKSPSGAACAVVAEASPNIRNERQGWRFWKVTATGEDLQELRYR